MGKLIDGELIQYKILRNRYLFKRIKNMENTVTVNGVTFNLSDIEQIENLTDGSKIYHLKNGSSVVSGTLNETNTQSKQILHD